MRGRTNIPNRKEPVINGDTKTFTVAENNTIEKGDFVSYKMATLENQLGISGNVSQINLQKFYIVDETNGVFLFLETVSSNRYAIRLAKVNSNNEIEVIDSIIGDSSDSRDSTYFSKFWYDRNEEILSVKRYGNVDGSSQYYFELYDVSISGFTIHQNIYKVSDLKTATGSTREITQFIKLSNKFFAINEYSFIYALDSSLTLLDTKSLAVQFDVANYIDRYDANTLFIAGNGNNTTGTTGTYILLYNINTYTLTYFHDNIGYSNQRQYIVQNKTVISFEIYRTSVTVRLYKLDENTNEIISFYSNEFTVGGYNTSICGVFGGDKVFIISSDEQYANVILLTYNRSSSEVLVAQNDLQQFNYTLVGGIIGFAKGNTLFILSYNKYYKMLYKNSMIEIGEPTSYVRSYDGKNALGFARFSGNAGDTIQVYVPPTNS